MADSSGGGETELPATLSGSFKGDGKAASRRRASIRRSLEADEFINLLHGSDPVKVELNRLENEVRGVSYWIEKLSQTVRELEEAVLAGGAAANAVRDYQPNRVAVVVANEWKDANDKVMPVKQWLEERRFMQLRSSLSSSTSAVLKHAKGTSKSFDGGTRSLDRGKVLAIGMSHSLNRSSDGIKDIDASNTCEGIPNEKLCEHNSADSDDTVSGLLYDMLQKEVITLRKACHEKDQSLKDKDDAIEVMLLMLLV
ncbi:hypothetical protein B296_00044034 [Ensete ventricosum]|uniref:Uncharacterized protein n=1 Tax=Ensete ventricosum TaxID=4639 RepID=A0A426ZCF3_ENSVE|nr:hypothetical protein B296_00044034 [Ensete ventricosum]